MCWAIPRISRLTACNKCWPSWLRISKARNHGTIVLDIWWPCRWLVRAQAAIAVARVKCCTSCCSCCAGAAKYGFDICLTVYDEPTYAAAQLARQTIYAMTSTLDNVGPFTQWNWNVWSFIYLPKPWPMSDSQRQEVDRMLLWPRVDNWCSSILHRRVTTR